MKFLLPFTFSLIAAIGNALFVLGQKKAVGIDNPFMIIAIAIVVCGLLTVASAPFFGEVNFSQAIKQNGFWGLVSGFGLFLAYLGFNLLYTKFGATYYIVYAVLSIITTTLFVGVLIFHETFNFYHWMATLASIVTIILFAIGSNMDNS